jgi:hypothetical protein
MIFLICKEFADNKIDVVVYESLKDLSQRVEWQDIISNTCKILDEDGVLYRWDDSKREEWATVFDYSFKAKGTDLELLQICNTTFSNLGYPESFELEIDN